MIPTSDHNGDLQSAIDAAISSDDIGVYCDKVEPLTKPVLAAKIVNDKYQQVCLTIRGDAMMNDNEKRGRIRVTKDFKGSYLLAIQEGKGCLIQGLNIKGNEVLPDSSTPQCCIAIDPHSDGQSRGGSTGIVIDNCTTGDTTGGIIISPNGHTQNGELMTVSNHRFRDCNFGFAGCQQQEKLNRLINLRCWDSCNTLLKFNSYGEKKGGFYIVDGVNAAIGVKNLIHRESGGGFALHMSNVYAESLMSIGTWYTQSGDTLNNSSINFNYTDRFPDYHFKGEGVTFNNTQLRYYGHDVPLLMQGRDCQYNNSDFTGLTGWYADKNSYIDRYMVTVVDRKITIPTTILSEGDNVFFSTSNHSYAGLGFIETVGPKFTTIGKVSSGIVSGKQYNIGRIINT